MNKALLLKSYIYIFTAATLFGFLVFGGQIMGKNGFSLIEVLIIPNTIVSVILFGFVYKNIKNFFHLPLWVTIMYLTISVLGQVCQYAPLFMGCSVSLTVFLLYTQPIWTILINVIFLKTKFTIHEVVTAVLVIVGLVFLLAPWRELGYSVLGIILAATGGLCISAWVLFSSYFSKNDIKPLTITFFSNAYTSVPFILAYPLIIKFFKDPSISSFTFNHSMYLFAAVFYILLLFLLWHTCFSIKPPNG